MFYAAVECELLDCGGRVIDGGARGTVTGEDGKRPRLTFLGQQALCAKGITAGIIAADQGPPYRKRPYDQRNSRRQALSGDLLLCKCERNPRIVSVNGRKTRIAGDSSGATAKPQTVASSPTHDDRFVLRHATGHVLAYTAYALCEEAGTFEYGESDAEEHTHLLASNTFAENIHVHLAG